MNPGNWPKVKEIFDHALARPAREREAFVRAACAGDEVVRQEVESLLRSYEDAESFMETPAVESAARSLAGEGKLSVGQQIMHYAIQSLVGEGGMGQVYLAQDLTLKRKVALKVLPADVAGNADRMRRFRQEATSAAALNHPNIAHIYQVGEDQGVHFIAMEYVDGITLRQLIHERRAELPKLLRHLQHVAEGLSRAHTAGIVHRDLKPDNIMVSRDGHAKILDFGLAKLVESEAFSQSGGPAETAFPRSMPGAVLGTAGYMSPEQAQGQVDEIDQRSDIFSFGCILFEAVTRQKAFAGKDVIESLNKIIREPPPSIAALNPSAPPDLHRIVRRCLAKDPEDRYQTIKEVAIEIKEVRRELDRAGETHTTAVPAVQFGAPLSSGVVSAGETLPDGMITPAATDKAKALTGSTTSAGRPFARRYLVPVILVLLVVAGGITLGVYLFRPDPPSGAFQKTEITQLTTSRNLRQAAISPDGKYIAYAINEGENESLWMRQANAANDLQIVSPKPLAYEGITFTRDSTLLYYVTRDRSGVSTLSRIPVLGGTPQKVITGVDTPVTFSPDGSRFAFVRGKYPTVDQSALLIASSDGRQETVLASHRAPIFFYPITNWTGPSWSPDGELIACAVTDISSRRTGNVYTFAVKDGVAKKIMPNDFSEVGRVEWLADMSGLVMVGTEKFIGEFPGQIFYVSYPDGATRRITNDFGNYRALSITSDSSKLVTISFNELYGIWVAPDADASRARQILPVGRRASVSWTPDGRIVYATPMSGRSDIWITNVDGGGRRQLTSNAEQNIDPAVSPDGKYVAFYSTRNGWGDAWRIDIDGSNPRELTRGLLTWQQAWTPDSQWILFLTYPDWKIWKVPMNGGGAPVPVTDRPSFRPTVSPDGKSMACFYSTSDVEVSTGTVYDLAIISLDGSFPPKIFPIRGRRIDAVFAILQWTVDGRAILYNSNVDNVVNIWRQPIDGGEPKQVTDFKDSEISSFAWSRDGRSLALTRGTLASDAVMISQVK